MHYLPILCKLWLYKHVVLCSVTLPARDEWQTPVAIAFGVICGVGLALSIYGGVKSYKTGK